MIFKIAKLLSFLALVSVLSGCVVTKNKENMFKLDESVVERRNLQTCTFEIENKRIFFETVISVLQDMGYIITESNLNSNILTASKRANLSDQEQFKFIGNLFATPIYYDVNLSLTIQPSKIDEKNIKVRTMFNQQIWALSSLSYGLVKFEGTTIEDSLYSDFFSIVKKALFIERSTI
jgi:hypothetical protein